jgi:hypothetical protein
MAFQKFKDRNAMIRAAFHSLRFRCPEARFADSTTARHAPDLSAADRIRSRTGSRSQRGGRRSRASDEGEHGGHHGAAAGASAAGGPGGAAPDRTGR